MRRFFFCNLLKINQLALVLAFFAAACAGRNDFPKNPEDQKAYPEYITKTQPETAAQPAPAAVRLPPAATAPTVENAPDEPQKIAQIARGKNESSDYLMGKFSPEDDPRFVKIDAKFTDKAAIFLRKEAYEDFVRMAEAAKKDGIRLRILSATRNFSAQKGIWEAKWTGKTLVGGKNLAKTIPDPKKRALKILEYSSMPGTSRHHWGTDIDLNDLSDAFFTKKNSEGIKIFAWLTEHAAEFGFCQPYSKGREHGYHEEKWHWTYLPISKKLTETFGQTITDDMISGFAGSQTAPEIEAVKHYVLGIAPACK